MVTDSTPHQKPALLGQRTLKRAASWDRAVLASEHQGCCPHCSSGEACGMPSGPALPAPQHLQEYQAEGGNIVRGAVSGCWAIYERSYLKIRSPARDIRKRQGSAYLYLKAGSPILLSLFASFSVDKLVSFSVMSNLTSPPLLMSHPLLCSFLMKRDSDCPTASCQSPACLGYAIYISTHFSSVKAHYYLFLTLIRQIVIWRQP